MSCCENCGQPDVVADNFCPRCGEYVLGFSIESIDRELDVVTFTWLKEVVWYVVGGAIVAGFILFVASLL
jgi:hypothetical protein